MKKESNWLLRLFLISIVVAIGGCSADKTVDDHTTPEAEYARGDHGGRLLIDGPLELELTIFETGVPPEFRVWATLAGEPLDPTQVKLNMELTRLGNRIDRIGFTPQGDFLRGDTVVYEPHSFVVAIEAQFDGETHQWRYDNFEGRTQIPAEIADTLNVETAIAEHAVLTETITAYGRIEPNQEQMRSVSARFDGLIQSVRVSVGDIVKTGQPLIVIESNESLKPYTVDAPIDGVITQRRANPGEQTNGRELFTIVNTSSVWANLTIFPADRAHVRIGAPVTLQTTAGEQKDTGSIDQISIIADANQAVTARVVLDNTDAQLIPGTYLQAEIQAAEYEVPLAVKRDALQSFRDFTVVYAQVGDTYEVRMLELGRQDSEWVEVLGGLMSGTRYVSANSYLIKADIEKSGALHDH